MSMFFDSIRNHFENQPDAVAVTDELGNILSYHDLDVLSAKVYAYLRSLGIGKGQMVLILLPRSAIVPAAMMGVIRSGAAFSVLEADAPAGRIEFIRSDCGCVLTLDMKVWEEILRTEPLYTWAAADEHDLLTAAYTSGTTGTPKGVLLERGILDLNSLSSAVVEKTGAFCRGDSIAIGFPMNYIVFTICFGFFYMGGTLHILSHSTARDVPTFISYLQKIKPDIVFLIPSLYKALGHALPSSVRSVFLGGERAEDLPARNDLYAVNIFSTTEIGYVCSYCIADGRPGVLPLGEQLLPDTLLLLDPDGRRTAPGKYGEIYARTPYTRGYLGLPKETEANFVRGYFRTGDLGQLDSNGNIVCCGRADDMIKISGNRVEPEEIASVFRHITERTEVCVKGCYAGSHVFLSLYYTGEELSDPEGVLSEMAKALPAHMLPSFFVPMISLPHNSNGKIDRNRLPEPDRSTVKKIYLPPTDDVEAMLCSAFSRVFSLERVGTLDDFLSLGGTSLMAAEIALAVDSEHLSVNDIYECGSILELAGRLRARQTEFAPHCEPKENVSFPLLAAQEYCLRLHRDFPETTMYNLPLLLRMDPKRFDAEKLAAAVEASVRRHPALLTRIFSQDGEIRQRYSPDLFRPVGRNRMSEAELAAQLDKLVVPFEIFDAPLYRAAIYETAKAVYLFFDVFHLVFDGTSFSLLLTDIMRAYRSLPEGQEDDFFQYLASRETVEKAERYRRSLQFFQTTCNPTGWSTFPKPDSGGGKKTYGALSVPLDDLAALIEDFKATWRTTSNAFFVFVSLLAMSFFNRESKVFLNWLYNCRTERRWMSTIGLFNAEFPVRLNFAENAPLSSLLDSVSEQIADDIANSDCNWGYMGASDAVSFIYQKDIYHSAVLEKDGIEPVELPNPRLAVSNDFDIEVYDDAAGLSLKLSFDASEYRAESAGRFARIFCAFAEYAVRAEDWSDCTVKDAFVAIRQRLQTEPESEN